jgi:hypothetical protein
VTLCESRCPQRPARGMRREPADSIRSREVPRARFWNIKFRRPFSRIFHDCRDLPLTGAA